jgi:hypothetical protein
MGVFLMYAGLLLSCLGGTALLRPLRRVGLGDRRRRRRAARAVGIGGLLVGAAIAWPACLRRARPRTSLLDRFLISWQFGERHTIRVDAPADRVYAAVRQVTAGEIRLFRTLTWLRAPRLPGMETPESILNAPPDKPILDVATGSGFFFVLAEEPDREIVLGALVLAPRARRGPSPTPAEFAALARPGYAKSAINFRVEPGGPGWCRVVTETRTYATDARTRRRFAAYWRLIAPGSAFLRRMWLRAIRTRATATEGRLAATL